MPFPLLPAGLEGLSATTTERILELRNTADGIEQLENLKVARDILVDPLFGSVDLDQRKLLANTTADWIRNLPKDLSVTPGLPFIDLNALPKSEAMSKLSYGFQAIAVALNSMMFSESATEAIDVDRLIRIGFGGDEVSNLLRDQLTKPFEQDIKVPKGFELIDVEKIIAAGNLKEHFKTILDCGKIANTRMRAVSNQFGKIVGIDPKKACHSTEIEISYQEFGTSPPPKELDLVLAIPVYGGRARGISLREAVPDFFDAAKWRNSGTLKIVLPEDVSSGCLQFYLVPPAGECGSGNLTLAVMTVVETAKTMNPRGARDFEPLVQFTIQADQYLRSGFTFPAGKCSKKSLNYIKAGAPLIKSFSVGEGAVYPRGSKILSWEVENAEAVSIVAREVLSSEAIHELPNLTIQPGKFKDSRVVTINCTRNWQAEYVLRATNTNGCGESEKSVLLHSGFRKYKIGVAKREFQFNLSRADYQLAMLGFSDETQKALRPWDPIYARAFVIEDFVASSAKRIAVVVMDLWGCSQPVKTAVAERLANRGFSDSNIMICGTHTHSAPGGFFHHFLYNLTLGGFDQEVFNHVVNTVVEAVLAADNTKVAGRIFQNSGEIKNCGANRSLEAFRLNPESSTVSETDEQMLLLKFVSGDGAYGSRPVNIGCLNWFAMHPTNLGMYNDGISGDNKGWASKLFEEDPSTRSHNSNFVAAFANAACGDVSGNVERDANGVIVRDPQSGIGKAKFVPPLGKIFERQAELDKNRSAMEYCGQVQFEAAKRLFDDTVHLTEVDGPIDFKYTHLNISNVRSDADPNVRLTWEAAMGTSFGAGSTEDGKAFAYLGFPISSGIIEGVTLPMFDAGGREAMAALTLPLALVAAANIASGGAASSLTVPALIGLVNLLLLARLSEAADAWTMNNVAYAALTLAKLPFSVHKRFDGTADDFTLALPAPLFLGDFRAAHAPKPIMFPAGLSTTNWTNRAHEPCPMVPNKVPIQILKLGNFAIAGIPAEITGVAGLRLRNDLKTRFGGGTKVALGTYANSYSGYITTEEEYGAQHYEGASTLYGPKTLEAYIQEFGKLATAIVNNQNIVVGDPEALPGVFHRPQP